MTVKLDHLVIGASSLEQGVAYVKSSLGLDIPKGGEHPLMSTHNHLMQLGNDTFLEVVAINPDAGQPKRPRWFGLDDPSVRSSLAVQPRLLTWVVNTDALEQLQAKVSLDLGVITPMTRGDLNWLFAVPDDGRLLAGGFVPHAMQWQTTSHPSANMADLGCRLSRLTIHHPYPLWLSGILDEMNASEFVEIKELTDGSAAFMTAELETPTGRVVLGN